jgi:hypothetical protein
VLTQRVSTASTQPRTGQTPSAATLSKLKGATYISKDLSIKGGCIAPDGEPCGDYPKGWRFLPVHHSTEVGEMLKKIPKVAEALQRMSDESAVPSTRQYKRDANAPYVHQQKMLKYQTVVANAYHDLVIAPQIKAEKEQKEREEEEQRQTIATLKMRVQELTKRPIAEPTAPAVTSSLPIIPIAIIAVIVGFFLLRRRA